MTVEMAEKFGGRLLDKVEYPNLEKSEEIGVLVNIIFKSEGELERFMEVVTLK